MNKNLSNFWPLSTVYTAKKSYQLACAFMIFLCSFSVGATAVAAESWQYVGGEKYSFVLPDRPLMTAEAQDLWNVARADNDMGSGKLEFLYQLGKYDCPAITKLYQSIYDRIIKANHLTGFIEQGPGMDMRVFCNDLEDQRSLSSYVRIGNHMVLNASDMSTATSEDELAFIIGHEMSHALLAHTELISLTEYAETVPKGESDADIYGTAMMWNAGFNPYQAVTSVKNIHFNRDYLRGLTGYIFETEHGSIPTRQKRILSFLSNVPRTNAAEKSELFLEAKAEYKKLKKIYSKLPKVF